MIRNFSRKLYFLLPLITLSAAVMVVSISTDALAQMARIGQPSPKTHNPASADRAGIRSATRPRHAPLVSGAQSSDAQPIFLPAIVSAYEGGVSIRSIAVADVNGDANPDMIVAGDRLLVRLGNGDGTFQSENWYYYYGYYPSLVVVADEDHDGIPDLVLAGGNLVNVLRGNGNGTFHDMGTYTSGVTSASSLAVADVNNDGKLDVVVADWEWESKLGVLLGNGDGTFRAPTVYPSLGGRWVTVADVNLDGKPDLLVANWSSNPGDDPNGLVGVLLGNGDGTFQPGVTFGSGGYSALAISAQDVNGDGKPDLLVMSGSANGSGDGVVGVLLGNGDGTFQPAVDYFPGQKYLNSLAVVDVNRDHRPDLLVTSGNPDDWVDGLVSVLLGNGDGTFRSAETYDSGGYDAVAIALADVNRDNRPDLIVGAHKVNYPGGYTEGIGVLLNNAGAPPTTTTLASDMNPTDPRQTITYKASVLAQSGGAVTGSVLFRDGTRKVAIVSLSGNQAICTQRYKRPGTHPISAAYSGDLQNGGSTSATLTEYIQGPSQTILTTSQSPAYVGQALTFTATVSAAGQSTGTIPDGELVAFYDGTTFLHSVALAGGMASYTTTSLAAKDHYITATYAGDSLFKPSRGKVWQAVERYSTTTKLRSSPNPSAYGQKVTFTATVAASGPYPLTGKVTFSDGTLGIGSAALRSAALNGGIARLTKSNLAVGTHSITARYVGDPNSDKSTSPVLNQVVK